MCRLLAVSFMLTTLTVLGCEVSSAPSDPEPAASALTSVGEPIVAQRLIPRQVPMGQYPYQIGGPISSAARPPVPLKSDASDNVRHFAPQNYAITAPPDASRNIRPMVEWEPMMALTMSFPNDMPGAEQAAAAMVDIAYYTLTAADAEVWMFTEVSPSGGTAGMDFFMDALVAKGTPDDLLEKIRWHLTPINDIWTIDFGPIPIVDVDADTFALGDFRYYHGRPYDDGLSTILGRVMGESFGSSGPVATYRMPINTEGGTFQSTTDGICITGSRQLYYMSCDDTGCDEDFVDGMTLAELNAHAYTDQLREVWGEYLGCQDVIVTYSITDDGTGHIDMYLKILDDDRIMIGEYVADPDYQAGYESIQAKNGARMDDNVAYLEAYDKHGKSFTTTRLIMPGHVKQGGGGGGATPFTYINSTFINGVNLWPATTIPSLVTNRDVAEAQWNAALPDMNHIWLDSEQMSYWSGAIHCITRTIPAKTPELWVDDGACSGGVCEAPAGGYSGDCTPNDIELEVCYGPEWLCGCNDCDSPCDYVPVDAVENSCQNVCGDQSGDCYCDAACVDYEDCCADVCEYCGIDCGGCAPNCGGKECGGDGCGGVCGTCDAGETCSVLGICIPACEDACPSMGAVGCYGTAVAWTCVTGDDGCFTAAQTNCAATGASCEAGACVPLGGTGGADAGGSTDTAGGGPGVVVPTGGGADDGCAGSPATPWWGILLAGWLLLRRRSLVWGSP